MPHGALFGCGSAPDSDLVTCISQVPFFFLVCYPAFSGDIFYAIETFFLSQWKNIYGGIFPRKIYDPVCVSADFRSNQTDSQLFPKSSFQNSFSHFSEVSRVPWKKIRTLFPVSFPSKVEKRQTQNEKPRVLNSSFLLTHCFLTGFGSGNFPDLGSSKRSEFSKRRT